MEHSIQKIKRWYLSAKGEIGEAENDNKYLLGLRQGLNGFSQIMLQENLISGLFFLAGIIYGSWLMGVGAVVGIVTGTLTARLCRFEQQDINKGLYGYNAALVGVAIGLFLKVTITSGIFLLLGAVVSTLIQHFFIRIKFSAFTLPFVLATWAILYFSNQHFPNLLQETTMTPPSGISMINMTIMGFSQVIFQAGILSGMLFIIGVLINSPAAAVFGIGASLFTLMFTPYFSIPITDIEMGLMSFNPVLCGIALCGWQYKNIGWTMLAVIISLVISMILMSHHFPQLTFPFVAATCITLAIKKKGEG